MSRSTYRLIALGFSFIFFGDRSAYGFTDAERAAYLSNPYIQLSMLGIKSAPYSGKLIRIVSLSDGRMVASVRGFRRQAPENQVIGGREVSVPKDEVFLAPDNEKKIVFSIPGMVPAVSLADVLGSKENLGTFLASSQGAFVLLGYMKDVPFTLHDRDRKGNIKVFGRTIKLSGLELDIFQYLGSESGLTYAEIWRVKDGGLILALVRNLYHEIPASFENVVSFSEIFGAFERASVSSGVLSEFYAFGKGNGFSGSELDFPISLSRKKGF